MNAKKTRLSVEERRESLLEFGREHFAKYAYDAIPMHEMARAAGVSKALLYHYFGGRKGFYLATIESVANEVIAATTLDDALELEAALLDMLSRFLAYVHENGPIYRALVRGGVGADPEVLDLLDRVRHHAISQPLKRVGITQPEARIHIFMVGWLSFVEHAAAEWVEVGEISQSQMLEMIAAQLPILIDVLDSVR